MDRNIPSDPRKWTDAKQKMYSDRFPPGDYPQANGMIMRVLGNGDVIWVDGKTGHQLLLKDDPRTHKTVYVDSVTGKAIGEAGMVVESKKEVADPRKWADVPQAYEPQRRPGDYAGSDGLTMRVGQGGSVTWIDPKTGHILLPKVDPKTGVTVHVDSETGQIVRRQVSLTGQSPGSSMQEEGPNLDSLSKMRQNVEGAPGSR
jgi:hypothetical protein